MTRNMIIFFYKDKKKEFEIKIQALSIFVKQILHHKLVRNFVASSTITTTKGAHIQKSCRIVFPLCCVDIVNTCSRQSKLPFVLWFCILST